MALVDIRQGYEDAAWFASNPTWVLKEGQVVHYQQTGTYKIGDGVTQLSALSFLGSSGGGGGTWGSITGTLSNQTDLQTALNARGLIASPLSQFAATTSAQLAGVISDETGTGVLVFNTSPTFVTDIRTPLIYGGTSSGGNIAIRSTSSLSKGNIIFNNGDATIFGGSVNGKKFSLGSAVVGATLDITQSAFTTGAENFIDFKQSANTGQTTGTEIFGLRFLGGSRQWATGNITTQRESYFSTTTYTAVGASVITNAYGMYIEAPTASTNITITNNHALGLLGNLSVNGLINLSQTSVPASPVTGDIWNEATYGLTVYNSAVSSDTFSWYNGTIRGTLGLVNSENAAFIGTSTNHNLVLMTNDGGGTGYGAVLWTNGGFKINPAPTVTPTSVLTVQASTLTNILELKTTAETVTLLSVSKTGVINVGSGTASSFMKLDASKDIIYDTTAYVSSVSGTSNRITSTGGTTPVIDISASYVGQSSITTLGTITTGTWTSTVVGTQYGGTGTNNATNASGSFLRSNGTNGNYIASTLILPNSATAQRIVFATSTNNYGESANLTFTPSSNQALLVKGNAGGGFYLGSLDASYGGFWASNTTPSATNYALLTNGTTTALNIVSAGSLQFNVSDVVKANMNASGYFFIGGSTSATALLTIGASTNARAQLNLVNGITPGSPNNGDIWFDGTDIKMRVGGVTKTFTLV